MVISNSDKIIRIKAKSQRQINVDVKPNQFPISILKTIVIDVQNLRLTIIVKKNYLTFNNFKKKIKLPTTNSVFSITTRIMFALKPLAKFFHTSSRIFAVEKSALAALRKKTGYTFSNCKKALELHNNDVAKAEAWLKQQAQALGWSKATKLEGRQTTQGLVGVSVQNDNGVLVEINCETDFVARNSEFENMVKDVAETCLNYLKNGPSCSHVVSKMKLDGDQLRSLKASDGLTLADKLALMIGSVGENATLKRAVGVKVSNGVYLTGYAHPSGKSQNSVLLGRIGGLVAIRSVNGDNPHIEQIATGLCQHIVGMAPKNIGNIDENLNNSKKEETEDLIHQEYLLDDSLTVKELLDSNQVEVVDFQRFECGETITTLGETPLDAVEVCQ